VNDGSIETPAARSGLSFQEALIVAALERGELVGLPTETVYGLAADATNAAAVKRIFTTKGRPSGHPLILHIGEVSWLRRYCVGDLSRAESLAEAFWPGPLTLILERNPETVLDEVTGGLSTVAVRLPRHSAALAVIRGLARPLAAPSANRFGSVSPTTAQHVSDDFGEELPLVLDGGPCEIGLESTIVDLTRPEPRVLRPGAISRTDLQQVLGVPILGDDGQGATAPGTLASHYAPRARVCLVADRQILLQLAKEETTRGTRVGVIEVDGTPSEAFSNGVVHIDLSESAQLLAHELYDALRRLDAAGCELILTQLPPPAGMGEAVSDRLRKAAAPRDLLPTSSG
jgi:L-threonylcarbamoyladenylate synthase